MLTFKKTAEGVYSLFEGDETILATAETDGSRIKSVQYFTDEARLRYSAFTMRSLAFALSNHSYEVTCDFYDANLELIGFRRDGEGMRASLPEINFDTCSCHGGNNEN